MAAIGGIRGDTYWERINNACQCEHSNHFHDAPYAQPSPRVRHVYQSVPAGSQRAMYVGAICDECAEQCMAQYLVKDAES